MVEVRHDSPMNMHSAPADPHLTAVREALEQQKQGQWAAAEAGYLEILTRCPDHAMAMHLLGIVLGQTGRASAGERYSQGLAPAAMAVVPSAQDKPSVKDSIS